MDRYDALDLIDDIRDTLAGRDAEADLLVSIVRDLHDDYPLEDVHDAADKLHLDNIAAGQEIKRIVRTIAD